MYCYNCGKKIDDKAVVCVHCGVETKNMKSSTDKNIVINNSASSSSAATNTSTKRKKKYNLLIDLIMICVTCGLWIIWMLIRPKYEY